MKRISIIGIIICLLAAGAFAQQDPRDPGQQDSVIIGATAHVDSSDQYQYLMVPVFAVTDDSVSFYNLPLRWIAPLGGVSIDTGGQVFPPVSQWAEHFDTVITDQGYLRQIGWADFDSLSVPLLTTDMVQLQAWSIRVVIAPNTRSQVVQIDTCYDEFNGSLLFGLWGGVTEFIPAFQEGTITIGTIVGVDDEPIPTAFELSQNYPNPFNPTTTIEFAVSSRGHVTLEVFNLLGQRVRILADGAREPGRYAVTWDGADQSGKPVSSGTYLYRLTTDSFSDMKRMVLLK
jgi:FlgD Ig-like domain